MRIQKYGSTDLHLYQKQVETKRVVEAKNQQDKIEISEEAKQLQRANSMSQERQEKVQKLKHQIETGTYKIDPKEIAKSMIQFYRKQ